MPTEAMCAWSAGFFECRGHLHIHKRHTGGTVRVRTSHVCEAVLLRLKDAWGGLVSESRSRGRHVNFRWEIHGGAAAAFLEAIHPWLVSKGKMVEVALLYHETVRPSGVQPLPRGTMTVRSSLEEELRVQQQALKGPKRAAPECACIPAYSDAAV